MTQDPVRTAEQQDSWWFRMCHAFRTFCILQIPFFFTRNPLMIYCTCVVPLKTSCSVSPNAFVVAASHMTLVMTACCLGVDSSADGSPPRPYREAWGSHACDANTISRSQRAPFFTPCRGAHSHGEWLWPHTAILAVVKRQIQVSVKFDLYKHLHLPVFSLTVGDLWVIVCDLGVVWATNAAGLLAAPRESCFHGHLDVVQHWGECGVDDRLR